MASPPVTDASPIIFFSRAQRLQLLKALAPRLLVPRAVVREIEAKGGLDPALRALQDERWLEMVEGPSELPETRRQDLGKGESAVLAWAHTHPGTLALLDDAQARACAKMLGIPVLGSLGVILRAKVIGLIPAARSEVELLVAGGMYLSRAVRDEALALVGE